MSAEPKEDRISTSKPSTRIRNPSTTPLHDSQYLPFHYYEYPSTKNGRQKTYTYINLPFTHQNTRKQHTQTLHYEKSAQTRYFLCYHYFTFPWFVLATCFFPSGRRSLPIIYKRRRPSCLFSLYHYHRRSVRSSLLLVSICISENNRSFYITFFFFPLFCWGCITSTLTYTYLLPFVSVVLFTRKHTLPRPSKISSAFPFKVFLLHRYPEFYRTVQDSLGVFVL